MTTMTRIRFDEATTLEEMLVAHDWTYEYSDAHGVWARGHAEREAIVRRMKEEANTSTERKAEVIALWNKHVPKYNTDPFVPMFNCPIR